MSDPIPPPTPIVNPATGATEVYVAQPKGRNNPVIIATSVTGILVQVLGVAAAFGLSLSDSQTKALLGAVEPIVVALFVLGPIVQTWTVPYWKTKALVDAAHAAGRVGADKPSV